MNSAGNDLVFSFRSRGEPVAQRPSGPRPPLCPASILPAAKERGQDALDTRGRDARDTQGQDALATRAKALFANVRGSVRIPDPKTINLRLNPSYFEPGTLIVLLRKILAGNSG